MTTSEAGSGIGQHGRGTDGIDADALLRPTLGLAARDGGESGAHDAGEGRFARCARRRHGHDIQHETLVERQPHAIGDNAGDMDRKHQLLRDEIFDVADARTALHVRSADRDEIDDDVEAAVCLRGSLGETDRRFGIAAGISEQLHLARRLGKHRGDDIELGGGGSGVHHEAPAVIGEFARNVYAASRRKTRDKHADASKLTVI